MKTSLRSLICIAAASACFTAHADHHMDLEKQYGKLKAAYWKHNYKQAISLFGTNFIWVKPMGEKVGYKDFAADLKKMFGAPGLEFNTVDIKNDSYSITGDEAMVRSSKHMSYSQRISGRMVTAHKKMDTVDTWRRGPGGWKLYKVQVLSQEEHNEGG